MHITIGEQGNASFLAAVGENISPVMVMVDDGSHTARDMTTSLKVLSRFMPVGGLYFLEDINPGSVMDEVKQFISYLLTIDPGLVLLVYCKSKVTGEEVAILKRVGAYAGKQNYY